MFEVPGQTKDQLYAKSLAWMAETFVSSKAVIEVQDKDGGKIIGNAVTTVFKVLVPLAVGQTVDSKYTLILEMKDGAVRFIAKGFDGTIGGWHGRELIADKPANMAKLRANMEQLRDSLQAYLTKQDAKW